jgi:hypothetical protein
VPQQKGYSNIKLDCFRIYSALRKCKYQLLFKGLQEQLKAESSHPQEPSRRKTSSVDPRQIRRRIRRSESDFLDDGRVGDVAASRVPVLPQAVRLQCQAAAAPKKQARAAVTSC